MEVSEADRRRVHNKLVEIAGETEANIIMEMFPKPDLVTQVSELRAELHIEVAGLRHELHTEIDGLRHELHTEIDGLRNEVRTEITGLRNEMRLGFANVDAKFASVDARFASVDTKFADLRAEIQHGFRAQTFWMIATMLTLAGVIVAAFAAFH